MSLNGTWTYEPQAWVTIKSEREWAESTEHLPPAGEMVIPGHWQGTPLQSFDGRVRFRRAFEFPGFSESERTALLVFKGVDYVTRATLNGHAVGEHAGYFQTFAFDVTGAIVAGTNELIVDVTCPKEEAGTVWPDEKVIIKGILNHWDGRPGSWDPNRGQEQNSGGIWNDVLLETRGAASIDHVAYSTTLVPVPDEDRPDHAGDSRQAFVQFDLDILGEAGTYDLRLALGEEPPVSVSFTMHGGRERLNVVVPVPTPRLWWTWDLGEPHLEHCAITLSRDGAPLDERSLDVGLREIDFDPERGEWWLNGERVFIRGTNVIPTLWLGNYDDAAIDRDIRLLRDTHINGVRVCVHVNREEFYAACDRAGILVWQDFALQWGYAPTPAVMQDAVRQIKDMVRLLGHHPSIGLWCCQNESTFHNKHILDPVLAAAVAAVDGTRYIRPTCEYSEHTYVGWYSGHLRDYSALPATPVLTEFGAQALPSEEKMRQIAGNAWPPDWDTLAYHDFQYDQTFNVAGVPLGSSWQGFVQASQAYQAALLKFAIERYRQAKYEKLGGLFQFMFMDCWPSVTWSVVDDERQPKQGYFALQQVFQPTLIGLNLHRAKLGIGVDRGSHSRRFAVTPWVVNDRHRPLRDCRYVATLSGNGVTETRTSDCAFDVPADGVLPAAPTTLMALPDDAMPGPAVLTITLTEQDQVISENRYELDLVAFPDS
jgi:beta-mannosidase